MKSTTNYIVVIFGLLAAGAFLMQSTYAYNLRKQLLQTSNDLVLAQKKGNTTPSVTPSVTLPPTTSPTVTLAPTLIPTPTEVPTQEIVYVTKTKTVYVTVTPTPTPTAIPTETPVPTPTPEHVLWQLRSAGNIVCRYPGGGDSIGVTVRHGDYPSTPDYVFDMPKTLDYEYSITQEGGPDLVGECYDFSAYDGDTFTSYDFYGISFERYPYMIDESFEFVPNGAGMENQYLDPHDESWTMWITFPS